MPKISKTNRIIASAVLAVILVGGIFIYRNLSETPAMIEVSENQENIEIKTGQEFTLSLTSNPSTGYSWSVDDSYDKNIVTLVSNEFEAADTDMSGAPGRELWVFEGTGQGNTALSFSYARQWEDKTSQFDSKTFEVTVQ